jgi:uncharacterized membrane protein
LLTIALLVIVTGKYILTKLVLKVWSFGLLILPGILLLLGRLLQAIGLSMQGEGIQFELSSVVVRNLLFFVIGIVIYSNCDKQVVLEDEQNIDVSDHLINK